jgi:hypothetical protein
MLQMQETPETRGVSVARDGTATLVPVAVDAVGDVASMLVALHGRIERQLALYQQAEGAQRRQYQLMHAIGTALATTSRWRTSCCTRRCATTPPPTTPRSSGSSSRTTCWTCSWWSWAA